MYFRQVMANLFSKEPDSKSLKLCGQKGTAQDTVQISIQKEKKNISAVVLTGDFQMKQQ